MRQCPNALLLAIVCAGLLAGCTVGGYERTLIQPDTTEGKACLPSCELTRTQCEGRQNGRHEECLQRYTAARSQYDLCVKSGAESCEAPEPCMDTDMEICRIQYEECFTACGGRVKKGLRISSKAQSADPESTTRPTTDAGDPP